MCPSISRGCTLVHVAVPIFRQYIARNNSQNIYDSSITHNCSYGYRFSAIFAIMCISPMNRHHILKSRNRRRLLPSIANSDCALLLDLQVPMRMFSFSCMFSFSPVKMSVLLLAMWYLPLRGERVHITFYMSNLDKFILGLIIM